MVKLRGECMCLHLELQRLEKQPGSSRALPCKNGFGRLPLAGAGDADGRLAAVGVRPRTGGLDPVSVVRACGGAGWRWNAAAAPTGMRGPVRRVMGAAEGDRVPGDRGISGGPDADAAGGNAWDTTRSTLLDIV